MNTGHMNTPPGLAPSFNPPTLQHTMPAGLGADLAAPSGGAVVLGLAIAIGGAYAGYKIGEHYGAPRHELAGKIIGAIAGWIIVPAVVGGILMAVRPAPAPTA